MAYRAAHDVLPGVTIVGFNTYGAENGTKWTKDVLDFGGIDTCDAVSYHHYENGLTGFPNDPAEKAYKAAMGPIIEKMGQMPKPVWMSEGAPLSGDVSNGFYRYTLPYENNNDNWRIADRMARFLIARKANGEAREFLYTMHGHSTFGGNVQWTTLVTAEGFLHPSAAAPQCAGLAAGGHEVRPSRDALRRRVRLSVRGAGARGGGDYLGSDASGVRTPRGNGSAVIGSLRQFACQTVRRLTITYNMCSAMGGWQSCKRHLG